MATTTMERRNLGGVAKALKYRRDLAESYRGAGLEDAATKEDRLADGLEAQLDGFTNCERCGAPLRDPRSIVDGYGPECRRQSMSTGKAS